MNVRTSNDQKPLAAPEANAGLDAARAQVDRILASDTFRAAEVLRRLLGFLADKTFSGEADNLKEYSVGLDALGKPSSYNPNKDAIVRLQASRLRQKLEEYYRTEGRDDHLVIELPRGRFKIVWRPNSGEGVAVAGGQPVPAVVTSSGETDSRTESEARRWRRLAISLAAVSLLLGVVSIWSLLRNSRTVSAEHVSGGSTPELEEIWNPFLSATHHLIIGFPNPLFVRLQEGGYRDIIYHTMGVSTWEEARSSPEFSALSGALGNSRAAPTFNMVERSTLLSTFVLSRFLARRLADMTLARSSDVSWQQLADNDVIVLGSLSLPRGDSALPVQPAFSIETAGVRNRHPEAQEPELYPDPQDHQDSDGEGLELISILPGPLGRTNVLTFSSNHAWGIICGVQALTDPSFARVLASRLRLPSGKMPPYYQLVLRISYRDGTPTTASYVNHRVLTLK